MMSNAMWLNLELGIRYLVWLCTQVLDPSSLQISTHKKAKLKPYGQDIIKGKKDKNHYDLLVPENILLPRHCGKTNLLKNNIRENIYKSTRNEVKENAYLIRTHFLFDPCLLFPILKYSRIIANSLISMLLFTKDSQ